MSFVEDFYTPEKQDRGFPQKLRSKEGLADKGVVLEAGGDSGGGVNPVGLGPRQEVVSSIRKEASKTPP